MEEFNEIREFIKQSYTFKNKKQYYNLNQKLKKMDRDDIVTQSVIIAYRAQKLNTRLMGQYVKISKKLNKAEDRDWETMSSLSIFFNFLVKL